MRTPLAFPQSVNTPDYVRDNTKYQGLTIRDYFAAKALQGLLATGGYRSDCKLYAEKAVRNADALMKALGYT